MIVFNATRFQNPPDMRQVYGMHPCVTQTWVLPGKTHEAMPLDWARQASDTRAILCYDYEESLDPNDLDSPKVEAFFDAISRHMDLVHEEFPWLKQSNFNIGWKSERESRSFDDVTGLPHYKGIADRCDFAAPECYLFPGQPIESWVNNAAARVAEARKLNKRVYLWINVTYDAENNYGYVPREHLLIMRQWCEEHVDAVILWGGNYMPEGGGYAERPFHPDDAWVEVFRRR